MTLETSPMQLRSDNFLHGLPIPPQLAFARLGKPVSFAEKRRKEHFSRQDSMLYGTWKTGRDRMSSDRGGALVKLHYALVFLDIAVIAGLSGFTGMAGTAAWIAKLLFVLFLVLVVIAFFRRAS
jgi:uncharacterized membrane protein YtjA (UPF0391 family)